MVNSSARQAHASLSYRPDIDGLRAIAVMAVIAFHAFPERLPGGFVGVDVFFVISGFLISSIIMRGIDGGVFSYLDFYARRIRRIAPALILVLGATVALGWWFLLPDQTISLGKEIIAGALFFYNLLLLKGGSYFDADATQKPLLHLWSLGVEEQFYIIWPVLVTLIWRLRSRRLPLIAAIALASFVLNIALVARYPSVTFYLPFTRFWQLLAGAMLAAATLQGDIVARGLGAMVTSPMHIQRIRNILSLLGLVLVGGSVLALTDGAGYPGWLALAPTLGAALLIAAGPAGWVNLRILSMRPVVFVGLISYPLYLWHWPALHWAPLIARRLDLLALNALVIEATQFAGTENSRKIAGWVLLRGPKTMALVATLLLAIATYMVVEKRVRASANLKKTTWGLFIALVVVLPIIAALQIVVMDHRMNGDGRGEFLKKFDMSSPDSVYRQATIAAYTPMCSFYGGPGDVKPVLARPCYVPRSRPVVMLWGDSHAMHLRPGLDALQVKQQQAGKQFEILQVTSGSCHAALEQSDRKTDETRGCNLANALALKTIVQAKPDIVVIAQAVGHETTDWTRLTTEVTQLGARHVIVVGPVPQWTQGLPQLVAYQYWPVPPTRLKSHLQPEMFAIDGQLRRQIVDTPALSYVSAINFFCDAENACRVSVGTDIMALTSHDSGHLTPVASVAFVEASLAPVLSRFIGK